MPIGCIKIASAFVEDWQLSVLGSEPMRQDSPDCTQDGQSAHPNRQRLGRFPPQIVKFMFVSAFIAQAVPVSALALHLSFTYYHPQERDGSFYRRAIYRRAIAQPDRKIGAIRPTDVPRPHARRENC